MTYADPLTQIGSFIRHGPTVATNHYTKMIYAMWLALDDKLRNSGASLQIIREKHLPVGVFHVAPDLVENDVKKAKNIL